MSTVVIAERFVGPPGAANGGYVAGLLASRLEAGAAVEVTLRRPVPVERELQVAATDAGGIGLSDGEELLAVAVAGEDPDVGPVPAVSVMSARASAQEPGDLREHPFPRCFGCGPGRDPDEAVALHPGPVRGRHTVWATAWTPPEALPHTPGGALAAEMVWVALDCPSSFATVPVGSAPHVLGRLNGRVDAPVQVGEEVVVIAWPLGHQGRKRWGASAIVGAGGDVRAVARATWIAIARA